MCWCGSGVCASGLRNAEGIFRTGSALFPGSLIRISLPEQRENVVGANVRMWHEADVPARSNDVCSWGKTGQHMLVESLRAVFGSIHRTCLSALVTDLAMEAWYHPSIA
jgi:hypothetical protein